MRLVWEEVVKGVSERTVTVGGRKAADGKAELFTESAGWYIQLGHMSLYAGNEQPSFKKGDKVRLILEHEQERDNADQKA